MTTLARRLGAFDATMIVMGGIIGSGIFINPYVVARQVHTPGLILGAWISGGAIALLGAFVYAELAALRPEAGGQYAYLRDAYHPSVAFLYGWGLLLVVQSGGMAAVAVTFAKYAHTGFPDALVATVTLLVLTIINCFGVRSGSNTQTVLMLLKLAAIAMLIVVGASFHGGAPAILPASAATLAAFAAAMTPVMFAYGGWQTASFMSAELKRPERDLAIGLLAGVIGVITVYVGVNIVCLRVLGAGGLAATTTPASAVMRLALGERGANLIAIGIAISTLGFLSQSMLTAPRVYYAMAADGLFFRSVAKVHPTTRVPVVAIALQGIVAIVIALSARYEQILSYVVSIDFIFFGLTGAALFLFRRNVGRASARQDRDSARPGRASARQGRDSARQGRAEARPTFRTPLHPVTTLVFTLACWLVVAGTVAQSPKNSLIGFAILAAGLPAYAFWSRNGTASNSR